MRERYFNITLTAFSSGDSASPEVDSVFPNRHIDSMLLNLANPKTKPENP